MAELVEGNSKTDGALSDSVSDNIWDNLDYVSEYNTNTQEKVESESNNSGLTPEIDMLEQIPPDDVNKNVELANPIPVNAVLPDSIYINDEPRFKQG